MRCLLAAVLLVVTSLTAASEARAQDCRFAEFTSLQLKSQEEVNSFQTDYGPCDTLLTGLVIAEATAAPGASPITNLEGLRGLVSVAGDLRVERNASLASLSGLDDVTNVGITLAIERNDALISLDGLSSLTSIGSVLRIRRNPLLTNLDSLVGLTSLGSELRIDDNSSLRDIDGLSGLSSIPALVTVFGNDVLSSLQGLSNVTTIGGNLVISLNALTSLAGLDNLTAIDGSLFLRDNPTLESTAGLERLSSIRLFLTVTGNPLLADCSALAPVLGYPVIPHEENADSVGETVTFDSTNGVGARSPTDCLKAFSPPPQTVGGTVSGLIGSGLVLQNNQELLSVSANGPFAFVDPVDAGETYTVTVDQQPTGQSCVVTNGSGVIAAAPVNDVEVVCSGNEIIYRNSFEPNPGSN